MRRFLSLPCLNRNITTSLNTRCVTINHHINFPNNSSSNNNLLTVVRCRHQDTHLKDHLKDLHPRVTSLTRRPTCLNSKIRSVTSLLGHHPSNHPSLGLDMAASTHHQHHPTDLHHFTSSPEASKTNHKAHNNPLLDASQHHSKPPQTNTPAVPAHLHPPAASKDKSALTASTH